MDCGINEKMLDSETRLILAQKLLGCAYILVISCLLEVAFAIIIFTQLLRHDKHYNTYIGIVFGAVFSQLVVTTYLIKTARRIRSHKPVQTNEPTIKV